MENRELRMTLIAPISLNRERIRPYETIPGAAHTHFNVVRRLAVLHANEPVTGKLSAEPRFPRTTGRSERRGAEVQLRELQNLSRHVARILGLRARSVHSRQACLRLRQSGRAGKASMAGQNSLRQSDPQKRDAG